MGRVEKLKYRLSRARGGHWTLAAVVAVALFLVVPTGTPEDVISLWIAGVLGWPLYGLVVALLGGLLVLSLS